MSHGQNNLNQHLPNTWMPRIVVVGGWSYLTYAKGNQLILKQLEKG